MDLSFLIPSKMRRKVLEYFCADPDAEVYVNELARILNAAPQPVYRELINLENWGFLFSSKRGNQRVFRVNRRFVFYPMMTDIFRIRGDILSRPPTVAKTYDWEKLARDYGKIPIPVGMAKRLGAKRTRPRSYDEEMAMRRKGWL